MSPAKSWFSHRTSSFRPVRLTNTPPAWEAFTCQPMGIVSSIPTPERSAVATTLIVTFKLLSGFTSTRRTPISGEEPTRMPFLRAVTRPSAPTARRVTSV